MAEDPKLATALRQAKQQPMFFAFVAKGTTEGVLIVSKKKIPVKEINEAKAESGGKKVLRGRCLGQDGKMVFEMAKEPPSTLAKQLKAVIHESAGMMLQIEARRAADLEEEGEEGESSENPNDAPPAAPPLPSGTQPSTVPPAPPNPLEAKFGNRLKALTPIMQRIEGIKSQPAKDAKLALSEANTLFRAKKFQDASDTLDIVESLIKEALASAGGGQSTSAPPPAPPPPQQDSGAARFATRLKALAPILPKAEATGSDLARQAKTEIAQANKLYVAKQYDEANAALDNAERFIKQALAGTAPPPPPPPPPPPSTAPSTGPKVAGATGKKVLFQQARLVYDQARKMVQAELGKVQQAILADSEVKALNDPSIGQIVGRLADVLAGFDEDLLGALDDALNATDDNERKAAEDEARGILKRYQSQLKSNKVLQAIDDNGFTPVKIRSTLESTLNTLAAKLA